MKLYPFFIIVSLLCISGFHGALVSQEAVKRYALIVGANSGGNGRVLLKYAVSDAAAFRDVMIELGSVSEDDAVTVYNPDKRNFYSALHKLRKRIENEKRSYRKREFFFYYSGHSDETGILLGDEKVTYKELKDGIKKYDVDVRIVILDSCSSGAFTRTKGGQMKPAFLVDSSYDMKGNAFMTSSSADEASQESDRIKGSFFTHYILAGMRGAADVSQDKKITLNEVYQFAYNSTLSRTKATGAGPQHPNYHIEMIGTGDVVLTDINRSNSRLMVDEDLEGKMLIEDAKGRPVAEFNKSYGQRMELGISPGKYTVTNNKYNDTVDSADITVPSHNVYKLNRSDFSPERVEQTRRRGTTGDQNEFFDDFDSRIENLFDTDSGGEYLIQAGNIHFSGYGGPSLYFSNVADEVGVFTGGKGGVIINDTYVFGGGGYGLVHPMRLNAYTSEQLPESSNYLSLGYGGFLFEYYYKPKSLITYSAGIIIGAGGYTYVDTREPDDYDSNSAQSFFAMRPEINAYINFTRFFRMGGGIGYTYFSGVDSEYFDSKEFNGLSVSVNFQFGWF